MQLWSGRISEVEREDVILFAKWDIGKIGCAKRATCVGLIYLIIFLLLLFVY